MSNIRHSKGDIIAGRSVGGRFAEDPRTEASSASLSAPGSQFTREPMFLMQGDVILVDQQIADTELLPLGSELDVAAIHSENGQLVIQTETMSGCGVFLCPESGRRFPVKDLYEDIRRPEWDHDRMSYSDDDPAEWNGHELGLEDIGVVTVSASGEPSGGSGHLAATVHEDPVAGGCLTQAQFNRGWQHLERGLKDEYGADVRLTENCDGESGAALTMEFSARLGSEATVSDDMVADIIWEKTEAVRFRNESNRGTHGSPFIYSRIGDEIDYGFFPGVGESGHLDHEVRLHTKDTASVLMQGLDPVRHEQLAMLGERGYCTDAHLALVELRNAYPVQADSDATRELKRALNLEIARQAEAQEYKWSHA